MPAIGNGVCAYTFPMPVRICGALLSGCSPVDAYSNSTPTTTTPTPIANPFVVRLDGVVVVPMKRVASANAGWDEAASRMHITGRSRESRIPNDTIGRADGLRFHARSGAAAPQRPRVRGKRDAPACQGMG